MSKIELNTRDLQVKTLDNGSKVVQIKGSTAFDEDFIEECEQAGVKQYVKREEDDRDDPEAD